MKFFFTYKPVSTSFGGGNQFVLNLSKYLINKNHQVVYDLNHNNIDIIIVIDPRKLRYNKYDTNSVFKYKQNHPNVKIIHRVNECDIKREKSIGIEAKLLKVFRIADCIVFVSRWLLNYYVKKYKLFPMISKMKVVINGCNINHFNPNKEKLNINQNDSYDINQLLKNRPIRLVTHHWSNNFLKGFDVYNYLDQEMGKRKDFVFTYIGNYNKKYRPKNLRLLPPMNGTQLANELRNHDIYITGTRNEPGAMHYLEGGSCGLPVVYHSGGGGALEVCSKFGEVYSNTKELWKKINKIKNNYNYYLKKIYYQWLGSDRCCEEWNKILESLR